MKYVTEILFVDPRVDDIEMILCGLRPGVKARVLDPVIPPARQIALALDGVHDLDAVHVIAHGAPGRVSFAAGEWSAETLEDEADDFAAIGRALAVDGELRLWSCDAGAGAAGATFIAALAQATGADVAAATGRIGAAALGGGWDLAAYAHRTPTCPLTTTAMAAYAGVLTARSWASPGTNGNWNTAGSWSPIGVPVAGDDVTIGGTSGSSYTVTLNVNTPALDSLTMNFSNGANTATLAIGTNTLNVNGTGVGATDTLATSANNNITISGGGILNAGTLSLGGTLTGTGAGAGTSAGTINSVATNGTSIISGSGKIMASGGTLDVFGTIQSGVVLSMNVNAGSDLKIEGTATSAAPISFTSSNQTLEIGASANLTINGGQQTGAGG